jgi:hypothetical protein
VNPVEFISVEQLPYATHDYEITLLIQNIAGLAVNLYGIMVVIMYYQGLPERVEIQHVSMLINYGVLGMIGSQGALRDLVVWRCLEENRDVNLRRFLFLRCMNTKIGKIALDERRELLVV